METDPLVFKHIKKTEGMVWHTDGARSIRGYNNATFVKHERQLCVSPKQLKFQDGASYWYGETFLAYGIWSHSRNNIPENINIYDSLDQERIEIYASVYAWKAQRVLKRDLFPGRGMAVRRISEYNNGI